MKKIRCKACFQTLPLDAFYKDHRRAHGHMSKCKECHKDAVRHNRMARIEYFRAYDRMRGSQSHRLAAVKRYLQTDRGQDVRKAASRRYAEQNRQKRNAQNLLAKAIARRQVLKEPCFVCGEDAEAHHAAYDLPLHVTWLCDAHHKQVHKDCREWARAANEVMPKTENARMHVTEQEAA